VLHGVDHHRRLHPVAPTTGGVGRVIAGLGDEPAQHLGDAVGQGQVLLDSGLAPAEIAATGVGAAVGTGARHLICIVTDGAVSMIERRDDGTGASTFSLQT
jgi:hypothetical protein